MLSSRGLGASRGDGMGDSHWGDPSGPSKTLISVLSRLRGPPTWDVQRLSSHGEGRKMHKRCTLRKWKNVEWLVSGKASSVFDTIDIKQTTASVHMTSQTSRPLVSSAPPLLSLLWLHVRSASLALDTTPAAFRVSYPGYPAAQHLFQPAYQGRNYISLRFYVLLGLLPRHTSHLSTTLHGCRHRATVPVSIVLCIPHGSP